MRIPLPRVIELPAWVTQEDLPVTLHPTRTGLNLSLTPLSTATLELPVGEFLPVRAFVEIYGPMGMAGVFRVRSPEDCYGDNVTSAELEHAVAEVGDWVVKHDYDEMKAAKTAMQTLFQDYGGDRWVLGSVNALGSDQILFRVNYGENLLEAMLGILEKVEDVYMTFDFSGRETWQINFVKMTSTVAAEGRIARNVSSARVICDDSELCTKVYYKQPESDNWTSVESMSAGTYGTIEKMISVTEETDAKAAEEADEYLAKYGEPRYSVEIEGEYLAHITGEALDTFELGKLFKLALPKYDKTIERHITEMSWEDVYNSPEAVTVILGDEVETAITNLQDSIKRKE